MPLTNNEAGAYFVIRHLCFVIPVLPSWIVGPGGHRLGPCHPSRTLNQCQ